MYYSSCLNSKHLESADHSLCLDSKRESHSDVTSKHNISENVLNGSKLIYNHVLDIFMHLKPDFKKRFNGAMNMCLSASSKNGYFKGL